MVGRPFPPETDQDGLIGQDHPGIQTITVYKSLPDPYLPVYREYVKAFANAFNSKKGTRRQPFVIENAALKGRGAPISFSFPVRERAVLHFKTKLFVIPHQH